ncbi:MAG: VWA domain-containing protein [Candidatus Fermentibacteraceae bacterium]|nr:VWA domain-containing protein [Candidatus Fermentibacteraceae bacterium]MBN2608419.1 VWA domain-containing protein [Candidatus Fermentibacteraceae bacterium]
MMARGHSLPFSAVMGLERAALAIRLSLVDDTLGGVLISGTRGTGKSTLASAARFLHPCLEPDDALVRVPLGVTEENLMGGLDLQEILGRGMLKTRPGLLQRAHGRILLIDNVNLLSDRLVDLVLDCTASGILTVEREGVSVTAESRFKLFATMDPEEGTLRPQLLDRFDMSVQVESLETPEERAALAIRLLALEQKGCGGSDVFRQRDLLLREEIGRARKRLSRVGIKVRSLAAIVFAMSLLEVDGHRPELVITKASGALAALRGRTKVIWDDVRDAAGLVTGHRTRGGGAQGPPSEEAVMKALKTGWGIGSRFGAADILLQLRDTQGRLLEAVTAGMDSMDEEVRSWSSETGQLKERKGMFESEFPEFMKSSVLKKLMDRISLTALAGTGSKHTGAKPSLDLERGKRVRVVPTDDPRKLDVLQTVIAAVVQGQRLPLVPLERSWWRAWERSARPRATVMLVIDASKSSSGYLFGLSSLLRTLFEDHFDPLSRVGLISMNRGRVVLHFKPTRNRLRVYGRMRDLVSEGYTPLAEAIHTARRVLQKSNTTGDVRGTYILLVSDCAPEPLPLGCIDPFESDLYWGVRKQADLCGMIGIPIMIIDPLNYPSLHSPERMPGRRLARYMEKVTRSAVIPLPAKILDSENRIVEVVNSIVLRKERSTAFSELGSQISKYSGAGCPWLRG